MIDKERLAAKCAAYGIALTAQQLDRLDAYARLLVDYNQKVNLTAITTPEGIEDRHFADSLLLAAQPEAAGALRKLGGRLVENRTFTLPDGSARCLIVCEKVSPTPAAYPRNGGKIAKKPL